MQTSLIPHLLKKDIRHVAPLLGGWVVLLLLQAIMICCGFSSGGVANILWQVIYVMISIIVPLLESLLLVVLIPILIQDEPLAGTTAFWFTRPISSRTLLLEKTLFVAVLVIIPSVLIAMIIFAANGISLRETLLAGLQVGLVDLAVIIPIAAIAVLTRSFAKFALWLGVSYAAYMLIGFVTQIFRMLSTTDMLSDSQNISLSLSRSFAATGVSIIAGAVVIFHQYITRNTMRSACILAATVLIAVVTQTLWRFDYLKHHESAVAPATFPESSVQPALDVRHLSSIDAIQFQISPAPPKTDISAELNFSNVPQGYMARVSNITSSLTLPGGEKLESGPIPDMMYQISNEWSGSTLSGALGGIPVVNAGTGRNYSPILRIDTEAYRHNRTTPVTLNSSIDIHAFRLQSSPFPELKPGAGINRGSSHVEISAVLKESSGCRLIMHERKVNLFYSGLSDLKLPGRGDNSVYLLVNRSRNQAILPNRTFDFDIASIVLQAFNLLINRNFPLEFTGANPNDSKAKSIVVDDDWLAGAELVRIDAVPAGTLQRSLVVPNLILQPPKR